jgi:hypothetical protein
LIDWLRSFAVLAVFQPYRGDYSVLSVWVSPTALSEPTLFRKSWQRFFVCQGGCDSWLGTHAFNVPSDGYKESNTWVEYSFVYYTGRNVQSFLKSYAPGLNIFLEKYIFFRNTSKAYCSVCSDGYYKRNAVPNILKRLWRPGLMRYASVSCTAW